MIKPAIVIAAYNRPLSLKRLLDSIASGFYPDNNITLIISIDFQNSLEHNEVIEIAERFTWIYGKKEVIIKESNIGLRNHILSCGELTTTYNAIIMLEDDIFVSPYFYQYAVKMVERYNSDDNIAGISLYQHLWNVNVQRPFIPLKDSNSVYFMQFAQSWGQCWTANMWRSFFNWYEKNKNVSIVDKKYVPQFVRGWSEKSWLKFFITYTIEQNKYFVYPYDSLSTNFGDIGSHVNISNSTSQVPLLLHSREYKNLPEVSEGIRYDAFFEIQGLGKFLNIEDNDLCVDLYGSKYNYEGKKFWLTSLALPYFYSKVFTLNFRPHELNIILENKSKLGREDIRLYNTSLKANLQPNGDIYIIQDLYDLRSLPFKRIIFWLRYFSVLKINFFLKRYFK